MRKPTDADLRLAPDNVQEYIAQLEKDRDAYAADAAAAAAAYAADAAAYAAAPTQALARYADIVRRHIPAAMIEAKMIGGGE